jgi:hypothetical protein
MTYRGYVKDGKVILKEGAFLADGTEVRVEPVEESRDARSLKDGLLKLSGVLKGFPSDLARNHDHYIHGTPRK